MNVFILDDCVERHESAKEKLNPEVFHCAMNVTEAQELLSANKYDIILLDHDLDEDNKGFNGWGTDIAKWMAENTELFSGTQIIIHSMNYPGAREMQMILKDAGLLSHTIPFPMLMRFKLLDEKDRV